MPKKPKSPRSKTRSGTKPKIKLNKFATKKTSRSHPRIESMLSNKLRLSKPSEITAQFSGESEQTTTRVEPVEGKIESKKPERTAPMRFDFAIEVDGRLKSEYPSAEAARKAALELKKKYPHIRIAVFNHTERTRTVIELS